MEERRHKMDMATQRYLDEKFDKVYELISKQNEKYNEIHTAFAVHCSDTENSIENLEKNEANLAGQIQEIALRPDKTKASRFATVTLWSTVALALVDFLGLVVPWLLKAFKKGGS